MNINGFLTKSASFEDIVHAHSPDIVVLCEIKYVSAGAIRKFFENLGYDMLIKKASGIVIASKNKWNIVNVTKSLHDNILAGSLKIGSLHITVVAAYGPQETEQVDSRCDFFNEVTVEIQAANDRDGNTVLVGDLNAKLNYMNETIVSESSNGLFLSNLVSQLDLSILNFNDLADGWWTRVQKKNEVIEKSVLDYMITTKSIESTLTSFLIDEGRLFSPYRIKSSKKFGQVRQYSDHNPIIASFLFPRNSCYDKHDIGGEVNTGWKLSSQGLQKLKEMTESPIPLNGTGVDIVHEFDSYVVNIMDSCFSKKKKFKLKHPNVNQHNLIYIRKLHNLVKLFAKFTHLGKSERIAARKYIRFIQDIQDSLVQQKKAQKVANTLEKLTDEEGQLTVDRFWKLKKSLHCPDHSKATIVSKDNVELSSPAAVRKEYAEEFRNRLSHKAIDPTFSEHEETTHALFQLLLRTSMESRDEPDFSFKEVKDAALSLNAPSSSGANQLPPDIYVNAGNGFFQALTLVLNTVKKHLWIPPEWFELLIVTIFKNKGTRKKLEYYRGIFLSNIITKILEKVIKNRIKPQLKKVNPLQAGSRENRSTCDTLFLVNGAIDHAKYLRKPLFITLYDYSTCFDSLWLEDSMIALWDLGVRNELFSLIFKLNEVAKIQVKTPFGLTDQFECPRIVKQGSVLSSNLCSSSTAQLCDQNTRGGIYTGNFVLNDVLYVDDTTDLNDDINEAIESNEEIVNFSKGKRLSLNHPKCGILTVNNKLHHSSPTLTVGSGTVPHIQSAKLVGDIINEKGNNSDMINEKIKNAKAALTNCLAMCNEVTMGLFFVKSSMILYQSVFLGTLLFNCQSWRNLTKSNLKQLEITQIRYLKRMMKAPMSTPNHFIYLELGALPVSYIIHCRQLTFLHHILHLDKSDPVKKSYNAQLLLPFEKNWANEVVPLLQEYHLNNIDIENISKSSWKSKVKQSVSRKAFDYLKSSISEKSKTKHLQYESFAPQKYVLNYYHKPASIIFKLRSFSVDCKGNRKSSNPDRTCRLCNEAEETQAHIVNCSKVSNNSNAVNLEKVYTNNVQCADPDILEICRRVDVFNKLVNNPDLCDSEGLSQPI